MDSNTKDKILNNDSNKLFILKYLNKKISTNLHLYIPSTEEKENNTPIVDSNGEVLYYSKSFFDNYWLEHISYDPEVYAHFTFVMNRDGTLWYEANLYIINLIQYDTAYNEDQRIPQATIAAHSEALQKYKRYCDEQDDELDLIHARDKIEREKMPYWRVAKRPFNRPNIKYRDYLQERVTVEEIADTYARKLLRPVTAFYDFINEYFGKDYLFLGKGVTMPGKVDKTIIMIDEDRGIIKDKKEANKIRGSHNKSLGYIEDGGNTKPLIERQQLEIFDLIYASGQPEIIISFLFAIKSAARMDTTFTLRLRYFMNNLPENYSPACLNEWRKKEKKYVATRLYPISIGEGTLIDAKGLEKRYDLQVPGWIMEMIRAYAISQRAVSRRENIKFPQKNPLDEYIFITKNLNPYYIAKSDPNKRLYWNMYNGGAIRVYITNKIRKKIRFDFKFHYLRATCLMNMNISMLQDEKLTRNQRMELLKNFAGHVNEKTTEQYLDYSKNESDRYQAYDWHGDKLLKWVSDCGLISFDENSERYEIRGDWSQE